MRGRTDPYLRVLAAVALVSVVTGAVLDLSWLPLLFPAVGVLFAVGGAVGASAADTAASGRAFLGRALTTLLLPFWLFAAAVLATMLSVGWSADPFEGSEPFSWSTVWLWLLPVSDAPASLEGTQWVATAWILPAWLWLTLATPMALWLFRRWPLRLLALPLLTVLLLTTGIATMTGRARDVVLETSVYGCCWLVGFARHEGRLFRLRPADAAVLGTVLVVAGLALLVGRPAGTLYETPSAALLYSLGGVVLLLRVPWRGDRLRAGWPGAVLSAVGARTMTVFLWAPAAAAAAVPALALSPLAEYHTDDASGDLLQYAVTWLLILVVVLVAGWAEDVGAGLRPTVLGVRRPGRRPPPAEPERTFVVRDNLVQDLPRTERARLAAEPAAPRSAGG